jgi:hypothetical protein
MSVIKPDGLTRKTYRSILDEQRENETDDAYALVDETDVIIGGKDYHSIVMEEEYDEGFQISADEGDLVFFTFVTYGYGETIEWDRLAEMKDALEKWSIGVCEKHNCTYKIFVTANYW